MSVINPTVNSVLRIPVYLIMAIIFNIAIFILIQKLVSKEISFDQIANNINMVDFVRLRETPEQKIKQDNIEELEPPEVEEEPPPPDMFDPQIEKPATVEMEMSMPSLDIPLAVSGTPYLGDFAKNTRSSIGAGASIKPKVDINVKPTLRVPPIYPHRALRSGIEGVVTVEFTIKTDGSVKDAEIIKAKPAKIFNQAVLNAIEKWKFNPDMVDGKPVEKRARQDIKFSLQR